MANDDIYAQKIDSLGNSLWSTDGRAVCTANREQWYPEIASDNAGGAIIVWQDQHDEDSYHTDIYSQRMDSSGNALWIAGGAPVCRYVGNQWGPQIVSDGMGGAVFVWSDARDSLHADIYAQRFSSSGDSQWPNNGLPICFMGDSLGQGYPQILSDGNGGFIIVWRDSRWGSFDIYAQRIDLAGNASWGANGEPICSLVGVQTDAYAVVDGTGGAIVAWKDGRSGYYDIYAARMPAAGVPWPEPPRGLTGTPIYYNNALLGLRISWNHNIESSISHHNIYRDTYEDFVPGAGNLLASPVDTFFYDLEWRWMPYVYYKVNAVDSAGHESAYSSLTNTDIYTGSDVANYPFTASLEQNYPNPFNPWTKIKYYLPGKSQVTLDIYDISGKWISQLVKKEQEKGFHTADWNGLDSRGTSVASGIYFYRLTAGKESISKKMVMMR